ncbi:MAG: hypothetical protein KAX49_08260 [Halanaerobiales bacterium]|nr:hypothetical protein [Halanaerobiales bacterium]
MSNNKHEYREFILIAEILALFHDLGKVNDPCLLERKVVVNNELDQNIHNSNENSQIARQLSVTKTKVKFSYKNHLTIARKEMGLKCQGIRFSELDKKMLVTDKDLSKSFKKLMTSNWDDLEKQIKIPHAIIVGENINKEIGFSALRHHFYKGRWPFPKTLLQHIIAQADNMDSKEDRTYSRFHYNNHGNQVKNVCNPFGYSDEGLNSNEKINLNKRKEFYREFDNLFNENFEKEGIGKILEHRKDLMKSMQKYFSSAPAMSQVPDHDTSVWDHCFVTASITKAILNGILINNDVNQIQMMKHLLLEMKEELKKYSDSYYLIVIQSKERKKLKERISNELNRSGEHKIEFNKETLYLTDLLGTEKGKYLSEYYGSGKYDYFMIARVEGESIKATTIESDLKKKFKKLNPFVKAVKIRNNNIKNEDKDKDKDKNKYKKPMNYLNLFNSGKVRQKNEWVSLLDCLIGSPNILAIQYPGRDFRTKVYRGPDFLGRKNVIERVNEEIIEYIEEKLALGNCVYNDVNGMYFIVPELSKNNDLRKEIRDHIISIFNRKVEDGSRLCVQGEIMPRIVFRPCDISDNGLNFGKVIVELKKEYETNIKKRLPQYHLTDLSVLPIWKDEWTVKAEICHVCGKRPVINKDKIRKNYLIYNNEKVCEWCLNTRKFAFDENNQNERKDIFATFISQMSDERNKVALLVGDFGLFDKWLSGDYIKTNVNVHKNGENLKPKPPSPSRFRSVVSATDEYYNDVFNQLMQDVDLKGYKVYAKIKINHGQNKEQNLLIQSGFYEFPINAEYFKRAIQKANGVQQELNEADQILFKQLTDGKDSIGLYITEYDKVSKECQVHITESLPYGYYKENGEFEEYEVIKLQKILQYAIELHLINKRNKIIPDKVDEQIEISQMDILFLQGISKFRKIYSLADEFMLFLPANRVKKVVQVFKSEFDKRFGKAIGRISLNMGAVFFDHKYPLYLIFDTGKRMLKEYREIIGLPDEDADKYSIEIKKGEIIKATGLKCKVIDHLISEEKILNMKLEILEGAFIGEKAKVTCETTISCLEPNTLFKKSAEDKWFARVIVLDSSSKTGMLKSSSEIQKGDVILFVPSMFDFQFVNSTESRLAVQAEPCNGKNHYERRKSLICSDIRSRPMTFDKLSSLNRFSELINKESLSRSSLYHLQELLIDARNDFSKGLGDLENKYFSMLIRNIGSFKNGEEKKEKELNNLLSDGSYLDLLELKYYHKIFDWKDEVKITSKRGEKND